MACRVIWQGIVQVVKDLYNSIFLCFQVVLLTLLFGTMVLLDFFAYKYSIEFYFT